MVYFIHVNSRRKGNDFYVPMVTFDTKNYGLDISVKIKGCAGF